MNSANSLKKILAVNALLILFFCIAYYILFSNIKSKNEEASRLKGEFSAQVKNQEQSVFAERMIQNADTEISSVSGSIIQSDGDVDFIENLEKEAKNNGLSITISSLVFEDDPLLEKNQLASLKITAKTKGSWLGNYRFLTYIESLPFKVKINKFVLAKNTSTDLGVGSAGPSLWESAFEIRVLKYK